MKQETKDLILLMIETWNKFHLGEKVEASFDESEFSPKHWSLEVAISGVVSPNFILFLLPTLVAQNCAWFIHAYGSNVIFHIQ